MTKFEKDLKVWLVANGYIGENWRFSVVSRKLVSKGSDVAEVFCEYYLPRKRKPHLLTLNVNFVKNLIYTDSIKVGRP